MSLTQFASEEALLAHLETTPAPPSAVLVVYSRTCAACVAYFATDGALNAWVAGGGHVLAIQYDAVGALRAHMRSAATSQPIGAVPITIPLRGRYIQRAALTGAADVHQLAAFMASPDTSALATPLERSGAPPLHEALPAFELCGSRRLSGALTCVADAAARVLRATGPSGTQRCDAGERTALLDVAGEDLLRVALALAPATGRLTDAVLFELLPPNWSARWGLPGDPPSCGTR